MCCCALQGILAANGDSPLEGDPDEWDKLFKVRVAGCSPAVDPACLAEWGLGSVIEC